MALNHGGVSRNRVVVVAVVVRRLRLLLAAWLLLQGDHCQHHLFATTQAFFAVVPARRRQQQRSRRLPLLPRPLTSARTSRSSRDPRTGLVVVVVVVDSPLAMGLYDKPLPPRPPSRDEPNDDDDDDDRLDSTSIHLFELLPSGKESRNRLPPLSRRLDKGIGCYYEPTDRLVRRLVSKTSCSDRDACWALEACQGDLSEAWIRISVARRSQLDQSRTRETDAVDEDWDEDLYDIELLQQFEQQKMDRKKSQDKLNVQDVFKGGEPDQQYFPTKNPRPVDDEPWFTG
jgi:hypothetical protein